jgi:hypothetical protein
VGLGEGWIELGISLFGGGLFAGGLAIGTFVGAVPAGFVLFVFVLPGGFGLPSHGGLATVAEVPLGRGVFPDATVGLEVVPIPLLVLEPVLFVVADVLPGEVGLAELPVAVVLLLEGVHGATVVVVAG